MPKLYDKETNALLGTITQAQLRFLQDQLEEESIEDTDYYLNRDTLDVLEQAGADADLIIVLRQLMGDREEMEIRWVAD